MQMEIFGQKNGLTEVQNVMHNKSFFVRHIYSRILKTILEPPSVGDKKSLDMAFQNSMYTKYTYYFLLSQKMYADNACIQNS